MRIFLTGANGFIGARLVSELIGAGHRVLGLTRSDAGAEKLRAAGAEEHRGDLGALRTLRQGAEKCDGVIHTAFDHDFTRYAVNCAQDERAIAALGEVLRGSDRPFVITSTTLFGEAVPGRRADEDVFNPEHPNPRALSEIAAMTMIERGMSVSLLRLSQIHDTCRQGLVSFLIRLAQQKGCSAYIEGMPRRWSAAHVSDTTRLYRLALEKGAVGARYHATSEEGVCVRAIAEAIGKRLNLPVMALPRSEAIAHFGWLYGFVSKDMLASSDKTRQRLAWSPDGPGLLDDISRLATGPA
ncbi:SDR family oxidoreductase [Swaminathania salitolerans]|uniref:NAD-dependent dehydratase n=1 Tax=Swaminathania salitolerans TaxID=182838 RepID=A0A511BR77_9PROT|nr:SDR family oxidoreductase [Swaminathania salitolerans]GBQ11730.1 nucleoside-diphosphate-sugar epimerase [Swaminathania salitolerans LMG 21291]GEL02602.1 NAD-dependent dehydratase [Swaminathania salitolerans]